MTTDAPTAVAKPVRVTAEQLAVKER